MRSSMRSSNPVLRESAFAGSRSGAGVMTVDGAMTKLAILLLLVTGSAAFTWNQVMAGGLATTSASSYVGAGAMVGFVLCLVISFKPAWAPVLAPIFAIAEGLFLGAISAMYNHVMEGIVLQATLLTIGISLGMLTLYRTRIIRVTQKLRAIVMGAVLAMFLVYLLSFILSLFGTGVPFLHSTGPVGIGISVVFVVICAFMLLLDFDMIERGAAAGAPKSMEWYGAFALLVTLIWLYVELLRLLSKLRSR